MSFKTQRLELSATEPNVIENSSILEGEQVAVFRSAYLAQDRADISEAIKCLARGMSKPRTRHMITVETCGKVLERSAKEGTIPGTRKEQSTFGSPCGQRLGRRTLYRVEARLD